MSSIQELVSIERQNVKELTKKNTKHKLVQKRESNISLNVRRSPRSESVTDKIHLMLMKGDLYLGDGSEKDTKI